MHTQYPALHLKMAISCQVFVEKATPLRGVPVTLQCLDYPTLHFESCTNERGEISCWDIVGRASISESVESLNNTRWRMSFDTKQFFVARTAFPHIYVELNANDSASHHVSLMILDESYAVHHQFQSPGLAEGSERHAPSSSGGVGVLEQHALDFIETCSGGLRRYLVEEHPQGLERYSSAETYHTFEDTPSPLFPPNPIVQDPIIHKKGESAQELHKEGEGAQEPRRSERLRRKTQGSL